MYRRNQFVSKCLVLFALIVFSGQSVLINAQTMVKLDSQLNHLAAGLVTTELAFEEVGCHGVHVTEISSATPSEVEAKMSSKIDSHSCCKGDCSMSSCHPSGALYLSGISITVQKIVLPSNHSPKGSPLERITSLYRPPLVS